MIRDLFSSGVASILAVAGAVLAVILLSLAAIRAGKRKRLKP